MDDKKLEAYYQNKQRKDMPDLWNRINDSIEKEGKLNEAKADIKQDSESLDRTIYENHCGSNTRKDTRTIKKKRRWIVPTAVAAVVLLCFGTYMIYHALGLVGYGSTSNMYTETSTASIAYDTTSEIAPEEAYSSGAGNAASSDTAADYNSDSDLDDSYLIDGEVPDNEDTSNGGESFGSTDVSERKLIKTVDITAETLEFDTFINDLKAAVESFGGYLESSSEQGFSYGYEGNSRYASYTIRVPEDQVDAFTQKLGEMSNVTYQSEQVEDVTLQYTDVQTRIDALKLQQEKLLELMENADSMDDIIALEERISDVSAELEYYQSVMNRYNNQISYSTVNLSLYEVEVQTQTTEITMIDRMKQGLSQTFTDMAEGFEDFLVSLVSALPYLVIIAVVVIVIVLICKKVHKKKHRK